MPGPSPQWTDFLSCEVCYKLFTEHANRPISLGCGHTVCKLCLSRLQQNKCPFDQSPINCNIDKLPVNYALLQLIGAAIPDKVIDEEELVGDISDAKKTECYECARRCIEELAVYLKPLSEDSLNELEQSEDLTNLKLKPQNGGVSHSGRAILNTVSHNSGCVLSRPMQRKLLVLINCQLVEEEGRSRAARAARSLGERSVTELILAHQNPQQLSANLWAAVRTRGCQFLGPGMQEEVLRLILLALEDGSSLSRKVLVLFVVQRLEKQYPQASKTAIGHVVQLLYRASCFKVSKREEESSLMQMKEEFRSYEALRLEHDAQIVQIAMEAGLRISPEQWSSLLYGDATHKSHMQSIIDKHQSPQSFSQGINELVLVLQRLGDPSNLCRLRPHLDFLAKIDPSPECPAPSWEDLEAVMKSLKIVVQGLVDFILLFNHRRPEIAPPQNTRYKTSMCRDFIAKLSCPRGAACTFAHSQDELEQYRCRSKKLNLRGGVGGPAIGGLRPQQEADASLTADPSAATASKPEGESKNNSDSSVGNMATSLSRLTVTASNQPAPTSLSHTSPPAAPIPTAPPTAPMPPVSDPPHVQPSLQPGINVPQTGVHMSYPAPPGYPDRMGPGNMRYGNPSDLAMCYQKPAMVPQLPQPLPTGLPPLHQGVRTNPPTHHHPPSLGPHPLPLPDMAPRAPCPHYMPADQVPSVYHQGMVVPQPMPPFPPDPAYVLAPPPPPGDMPPAVPGPPMQSLQNLRHRKSELISHLQIQQGVSGSGQTARNTLERVLATRPRPAMDVLSSSVNDTYVAMRTTNTLDDLEAEGLRHCMGGDLRSCAPAIHGVRRPMLSASGVRVSESLNGFGRSGLQGSLSSCDSRPLGPPSPITSTSVNTQRWDRHQTSQRPAVTTDLSEDGDVTQAEIVKNNIIRLQTSTLENEDDFMIPFDPPLVSKFGPISRNARIRGRNTDPVQVTAEENSAKCTPVLSVTPMERPYPTSAPVPSFYKPKMSPCPTPPISLPPSLNSTPTTFYSPWSGQDFWRWQIPEMVQKLEKSAIQANTASERLSLQLQSVELQISMKTGFCPKPVSQLLQEASPRQPDPGHPAQQTMGMSAHSAIGEERRCVPQRSEFPPEWK